MAKAAEEIATELGIEGELKLEFVEQSDTSEGWIEFKMAPDGWALDVSAFYIVTRPSEFKFAEHISTIAHELTHIQQARANRFKLVTSTKLGNKKGIYFDGKLVVSLKEYRDVNSIINRFSKSKKPSAKLILENYFATPRYKSWTWGKEAFDNEDKWKERLKSK